LALIVILRFLKTPAQINLFQQILDVLQLEFMNAVNNGLRFRQMTANLYTSKQLGESEPVSGTAA